MKQYLPIMLCLAMIFSCSKKDDVEKDSELKKDKAITFDQAMSRIKGGANAVASGINLAATPNIKSTTIDFSHFAGFSGCEMPEKTSSGITFKATQGYTSVLLSGSYYVLTLSSMHAYSEERPASYGSGMVIKYPFKQGSIYKIRTNISGTDYVFASSSPDRRYPTLQARLTNSPTITSICRDSAPIVLTGSNEPSQVFPAIPKDATKLVELQFIADKCYEYLWLSVIPNTSGKSFARAELYNNIIIEEQNQFAIAGPNDLGLNEQATFSVEAFSLPINSNFTWSVSGDLQIVGSNHGPNVVIKGTGINGGKIYVSLDGCQNIVEKSMNSQLAQYVTIQGVSAIPCDYPTPFKLSLVLSGSLTGKTITDLYWTFPEGMGSVNSGSNYVNVSADCYYNSTGGDVIAHFKIDGIEYVKSKYVKIQPPKPTRP